MQTTLRLARLLDERLDSRFKSVPPSAEGVRLGDVGGLGWNILREDTLFPVAVLKASAVQHNAAWMRDYVQAVGARLCPHGKTTMAPQIFELQLQAGAWGVTAATVAQVRIYRRFGVRRIFFANQLVGRQQIAVILDELERDPAFEFYALADSAAGVEALAAACAGRALGRPVDLLLEVGIPGGRTGVRSVEEGLAVARAIAAQDGRLRLCGVEAYEGIKPGRDRANEAFVTALMDVVDQVALVCDREGLLAASPILLSAGASAFFDMVAQRLAALRLSQPSAVILRSGCYISHDSFHYAELFRRMQARDPQAGTQGEGLRPALEVWAYVQSRPEPGRAFAALGKRDISHDVEPPTPLYRRPAGGVAVEPLGPDHRVVGLNDHHAYLEIPDASPMAPGDLIGFGVSHPCTTFDKWPLMLMVDDAYNVTGGVRCFF